MAKKKTAVKDRFGDDYVTNAIAKKYGDAIKRGTEVLEKIESRRVLSFSPALDICLNGGIREGSIVGIAGPPKTGKEQPLSSIVYTPSGPVKMGDIKKGDKVCTPDGSQAKVTDVFPQGIKDVYRITFNDGCTAECGIDHIWKVKRNDRQQNWITLTLKEILDEGLHYSDRSKWCIPLTKPVDFEEKELEIPPYILGCLLGDGGMSDDSLVISSADNEILESFDTYLKTLEEDKIYLNHRGQYDYRITGGVGVKNPVIRHLRNLNLMGKNSHSKFIPHKYKYASKSQRLNLIRGLMDTDGYNDKGKTAEYTTVSLDLAKDFQEVVQSLGYTAKIVKRTTKCNGKEFPSYRLHVSGNHVSLLFSLNRKIYPIKRSKPDKCRTIKKVEKVRQEESQCIMLDNEEHLYLTDNFAVTHNTTAILHFAAKCQKLGKLVVYLNVEGRMNSNNFSGIKDLDVEKLIIVESTEQHRLPGEDFLDIAEMYMRQQPECVIIVDSISNLIPKKELEGELDAQMRASLPKLLSQFFKRSSHDVAKNNVIMICVAHQIADTGPSRRTRMTDCGNMFQYQVDTNIEITHKGSKWEETKDGKVIGQTINWKIMTTNNGGIPESTTEGWLRYGTGIDEVQEVIAAACEFGLIKAAGAWYTIQSLIDNLDHQSVIDYLKSVDVPLDDPEKVQKAFKFQGGKKLSTFLNEHGALLGIVYSDLREMLL